jgi:hypothetical protein
MYVIAGINRDLLHLFQAQKSPRFSRLLNRLNESILFAIF